MSPRYLLLVGDGRWTDALLQQLSSQTGLELSSRDGRLAVFRNAACHCLAIGQSGCIVGSLFHRHGPARPVSSLTANEAAAMAKSGGQAILGRFWGGYVAAIVDADSIRILRDPTGVFPCYYVRRGGLAYLASDAELLVACGIDVDIDFEEVGRQLYRALVPSPATALRPIRELLPGFAIRLPGDLNAQEACWSPWDHVVHPVEQDEAVDRVSRVVRHCVRASASTQGRLLLSVSGGLDSSIIAACLASAGADTICLTMFADDPAADERPFARALCTQLGLELIERPYRLEDIDIAEPLATHLPRPRDRTQANAYERVHLEVAWEVGASAFMTGNGGDNVFGYSQSAAAIADRYLAEGIGSGVLGSLIDVCNQTGCSIFDAIAAAWRLAKGPARYTVRPTPLFLDRHFVASIGASDLDHPWLAAPAAALPGNAAHIASVLRLQAYLEASRGAHLPVLSPLVSQPIIETCLQIPSWEWRAGGRDRSVARRAFAHDLPAAVLDRRVKGTPGRFAARLLDHFRPAIRDRLVGGSLAAHKIVDAVALDQVLAGERPVPDLERVRILELVNVEAWLDHWAARPPNPIHAHVNSPSAGRFLASIGPIP
jgi:asparagine synthase (glutamine-hydrolysing)